MKIKSKSWQILLLFALLSSTGYSMEGHYQLLENQDAEPEIIDDSLSELKKLKWDVLLLQYEEQNSDDEDTRVARCHENQKEVKKHCCFTAKNVKHSCLEEFWKSAICYHNYPNPTTLSEIKHLMTAVSAAFELKFNQKISDKQREAYLDLIVKWRAKFWRSNQNFRLAEIEIDAIIDIFADLEKVEAEIHMLKRWFNSNAAGDAQISTTQIKLPQIMSAILGDNGGNYWEQRNQFLEAEIKAYKKHKEALIQKKSGYEELLKNNTSKYAPNQNK